MEFIKASCSILALLFTIHVHLFAQNSTIETSKFISEIEILQQEFHIPGLAVIIADNKEILLEQYLGYADMNTQRPVDSNTLFPIASITKLFSATIILQLEREGQLSLEDQVQPYFPQLPIGDSIKIKHLLSHTSQGPVGQQFYYSGRFGLLTKIIEQATKTSFEEILHQKIIVPTQLSNTILLGDSTDLKGRLHQFALPYDYDGSVIPSQIEFGYSTSAGLVCTANDLLQFSKDLDGGKILPKSLLSTWYQPFKPGLPYSYGQFSQTYLGKQLIWVYGQYDGYSSLLLKVPELGKTFILLGNNRLLSDPARLIYGDVTKSKFAMSFLRNFVFTNPPQEKKDATTTLLNRSQKQADALADSYFARFDTSFFSKSVSKLDTLFQLFPEIDSYANLPLLHNLAFLKDVSFHLKGQSFDRFDGTYLTIARQLLAQDPINPYTNLYLASYYDRGQQLSLARKHYRRIVETPNFSDNWYTQEARNWLKQHP